MRKMMFAAGVAVGYVLGSRAGRERYEQLAATARKVRDNQTVRDAAGMVQDQAAKLAYACRERIGDSKFAARFQGKRETEPESRSVPPPQYWETAGGNPSTRSGQRMFRF